MPILETIAVVAACISAFKDGLDLWATYKKNRRELRSGHSANLETALVEAPKQVTNHYYTCCSQGGHDFTKGDGKRYLKNSKDRSAKHTQKSQRRCCLDRSKNSVARLLKAWNSQSRRTTRWISKLWPRWRIYSKRSRCPQWMNFIKGFDKQHEFLESLLGLRFISHQYLH